MLPTLLKLKYYGINPTVTKCIFAFLCDRTQEVLVEGKSSTTTAVTLGVLQGSVLGPLLFLLYIEDLPDYVTDGSTALCGLCCDLLQHSVGERL